MSAGIVDTTVILHYFRKNTEARAWVDSQSRQLSVTSTTWLEVMEGVSSKNAQAYCKSILDKFEMLYLTTADQQRLEQFQFSHHIGMDDCMIASVAYRLGLPLYTHNLKDMTPLIGKLATKPYE